MRGSEEPADTRQVRCRLVALVAASVAFTAACSGSSHPTDAATPITTSTIAPSTTSSVPATTTTALPPAPSSTSVSSASGVVTIKGRGDRTVALPASIKLPAIVHAQHAGKGGFVVSGVDSRAHRTGVLASALGSYDGTFAVGFVEAANNATTSLRIVTGGPWQIDIGPAALAPPLRGGQKGVGDAVISYRGPATTAHLTYPGRSRLIVNVYANGGLIPLVNTKGPYDGPISLPTGPTFIAVTTRGKWSMIIE